MSFQDISDVLRCSKAGGIDKLILICLANYTDENHLAYPSHSRLAQDAGVERRTVIRAIDRLIELKELTKVEQGGLFDGLHLSNTYRVTLGHSRSDSESQGGDLKSQGGCLKVTGGSDSESQYPISNNLSLNLKRADSVDQEFVSELKNKTAYAFLDIDVEIQKMKGWISAHPGRQLNKQFVLNWLKKERETMLAKPERFRPRDGLGRPLGWDHEGSRI